MTQVCDYYPDTVKELREFKAIAKAHDGALENINDGLKKVFDEQFVLRCDEDGIYAYEKIVGIKNSGNVGLDVRKVRVIAKLSENIPYTIKSLESYLSVLCGDGGFVLEREVSEFSVSVGLNLESKKNLKEAVELLERALPMNMVYDVYLIYNRWWELSSFKWGELVQKSWADVREEEL